MPRPGDGADLKNRCGSGNLHQNDDSGRDSHRRSSMENNAEGAMIGVAVERVDVSHLHHGEQSQERQAQHQSTRRNAMGRGGFPVTAWLEMDQKNSLSVKDTQNRMRCGARTLRERNWAGAAGPPTGWTPARLKCECSAGKP